MSNRKNVAAPVFLFSGSTEVPESYFAGINLTRTCVFIWFDCGSSRANARRGDPFSHPSGSSAFEAMPWPLFSNRKEQGWIASSSWLPPARFSWSAWF